MSEIYLGSRDTGRPQAANSWYYQLPAIKPVKHEDNQNEPPPSLIDVITEEFDTLGIPLRECQDVIPDDDSTLFVCSGMQNLKNRFESPDGNVDGSVQRCIRTTDLELVGDGSHLTSFDMVGNFSFGREDFGQSILLWDRITRGLKLGITHVTVHPTRQDHRKLWEDLGYKVVHDPGCRWSDGVTGGNCTEMYVGTLEVGNLVNTNNVSTDVGFGLERMLQVVEGVSRVDQTSLFDPHMSPVGRDHKRTIEILWNQNIEPGNKGRNYVCRRIIRRVLPELLETKGLVFEEWIRDEQIRRDKSLKEGRKLWRKHQNKDLKWWWETCGLLPEEVEQMR